jgi:large subunit ribosomal protein L23
MAELREILIRPIMTEKTMGDDVVESNVYVFEVGLHSNKPQIKTAVEEFFNVKVASVKTLIVRGKIKRFGRYRGKCSNWKKAYVKLADGQLIESLRG